MRADVAYGFLDNYRHAVAQIQAVLDAGFQRQGFIYCAVGLNAQESADYSCRATVSGTVAVQNDVFENIADNYGLAVYQSHGGPFAAFVGDTFANGHDENRHFLIEFLIQCSKDFLTALDQFSHGFVIVETFIDTEYHAGVCFGGYQGMEHFLLDHVFQCVLGCFGCPEFVTIVYIDEYRHLILFGFGEAGFGILEQVVA